MKKVHYLILTPFLLAPIIAAPILVEISKRDEIPLDRYKVSDLAFFDATRFTYIDKYSYVLDNGSNITTYFIDNNKAKVISSNITQYFSIEEDEYYSYIYNSSTSKWKKQMDPNKTFDRCVATYTTARFSIEDFSFNENKKEYRNKKDIPSTTVTFTMVNMKFLDNKLINFYGEGTLISTQSVTHVNARFTYSNLNVDLPIID